jgi:hypothetical protein
VRGVVVPFLERFVVVYCDGTQNQEEKEKETLLKRKKTKKKINNMFRFAGLKRKEIRFS